MAIGDYKITEQQIAEKGVVAAPDMLTGTAQENKGVFDRLVRETVAPAFNSVLDALEDENEQRNADEGTRKAQETARVAAEELRVTAENKRVAAEALRAQAEAERQTAEQARADETAGIVARAKEQAEAAEAAKTAAETAASGAEAQKTSAAEAAANALASKNAAAESAAEAGNQASAAGGYAEEAKNAAARANPPVKKDVCLPVSGWTQTHNISRLYEANFYQEIAVEGVLNRSEQIVFVSPGNPQSRTLYEKCGVRCISHSTGSMIFAADSIPEEELYIDVVLQGVT